MSLSEERIIDRELRTFREAIASDAELKGHDRVRRILRLIQDQLFDPDLRVERVLKSANITSNVFKQTFKVRQGHSIQHYIQDRRIMAAMWLLNFQEVDITTIAYRVGYADYRSFARAFKRYVGCTASEFRDRAPIAEAPS